MSRTNFYLKLVIILLSFLIGEVSFANPQQVNSENLTSTDDTTSPLTTKQQIFIQAEQALSQKNIEQFKYLTDKLIDYPLYDYLQRDRLINELADLQLNQHRKNREITTKVLKAKITEFLNSHNNQVVSRKLRYRWLSYLAETGQVDTYLDFYQASSSTKLKCHYLQFQIEKKHPSSDIFPKVESIWLTGQSLPKFCDPLIEVWKKSGGLTQSLIWQRMLLAADKKQYRLVSYLNRQRPESDKATGELLTKVMRSPELLLSLKFKKQISPHGQTIIVKGLNKLAWKNPQKAIKAWKKVDQRLTLSEHQINRLKRSIGLSLAINHQPEAKNWLLSISNENDSSIDQWLLSSALNTQDWSLIEYITRQKKHHSIDVNKWRYWRAVSSKNTGYDKTSDWLLDSLANSRSYYGFLAAFDQQTQPQLNSQAEEIDPLLLADLATRKNAKNAYEFYQLGRLNQARSEWNHLIKTSAPSEYVALAQLAHQWGWQHQSILAFARSKQIDDVEKRFPFYQMDLFQHESDKHQIPISWAYAITRQESAFKEDATSIAGAKGLMQLTPSTARLVAKRQAKNNSINYQSRQQLLTPEINIKLGVAHLKEMLDHYNGHPILATAAYNAGQHRVDMWLKDNRITDSILWIEQIPYKETREYVKNVLTYQQIYSQLGNTQDSFLANISEHPIPTNLQPEAQLSAH